MDWAAWQVVLDWGGKLGLGGVVGAGVGWFLKRLVGERDSAAARGRTKIAEARPEIVPIGATFSGDHRGTVTLANRGPGVAHDIRVTFTGSAACGRVPEIIDRYRETPHMNWADASFFSRKLDEPAEICVRFRNRFDREYVTVLLVDQADGGNDHFGMHPRWGHHRVIEPRLTKKMLREIGGP